MLGLAPDTEHFHLYSTKSKAGALSPGFLDRQSWGTGATLGLEFDLEERLSLPWRVILANRTLALSE